MCTAAIQSTPLRDWHLLDISARDKQPSICSCWHEAGLAVTAQVYKYSSSSLVSIIIGWHPSGLLCTGLDSGDSTFDDNTRGSTRSIRSTQHSIFNIRPRNSRLDIRHTIMMIRHTTLNPRQSIVAASLRQSYKHPSSPSAFDRLLGE